MDAYSADWKLMFRNARIYHQEGSWIYTDADEMEKVFDAMFERVAGGSGLPGASAIAPTSVSAPKDVDEPPMPPSRSSS
jgi:ATP-dependent helicase STH1/SNF2